MLVLSSLLVALLLVSSVEPSDQRTFCLHTCRWCKLLNSHPPKRSGSHSLVEPIIQNQGFLEHHISTWIPTSPVIRHLHRPHLVFCDGYLHLVVFVEFSSQDLNHASSLLCKNIHSSQQISEINSSTWTPTSVPVNIGWVRKINFKQRKWLRALSWRWKK